MALQGTGPHLYRLQALLRLHLNSEVDAIDAAATTHAGVTDDDFVTEPIADADIQTFRDDREGECITLVLVPTGNRTPRDLSKHGAGANQSRVDQEHEITVYVTAKSSLGSWGEAGAWLRADRVAHGVQAVMHKYPTMEDTSNGLSRICLWAECAGWDRLPTEDEQDAISTTMVGRVTVRTTEQIA